MSGLEVDKTTHAINVIEYAHHEAHGGSAFVLSQRTAVNEFDIAAPMTFYIITPDTTKWCHLTISGEANTAAYWELFEDNGNTDNFDVAGGDSVTAKNRNRNSSKTSGLTITTGATVTQATSEVLIESEALGKSGAGGERHEFVLAQNTAYLVRSTSYADNNEGSFTIDWYEHTNKAQIT